MSAHTGLPRRTLTVHRRGGHVAHWQRRVGQVAGRACMVLAPLVFVGLTLGWVLASWAEL